MRHWVVVATLVLAAACGTSDPVEHSTPSSTVPPPSTTPPSSSAPAPKPGPLAPAEAAVDALMRALDAGDCAKAKRLVVTPSELGCDVVEQSRGSFADEGIDLDRVVYRVGPVHDDSAVVKITWNNGYPTESYDVQRVEGRWKVVFDSAA